MSMSCRVNCTGSSVMVRSAYLSPRRPAPCCQPSLQSTPMTGISNRLQTLSIPGPAGSLEALLVEGQAQARYAALVCHPHPKGGGTMHNKVVYHAMKAFSWVGLPVVRFNFRGTGLSGVKGLIGVGVPVHAEGRDYSYGFLRQCVGPKLFISGDHDQFGPQEMVEEI